MSTPHIQHAGLRTTFQGASDTRFNAQVAHFRGIPYGRIPKRFAKAEPVLQFDDDLIQATNFGPQCPQPKVDVGHLLRLPQTVQQPDVEEDEFKCLNLNVHCPGALDLASSALPVVVWIHGGSQVVTFAPASSPVCDPTRLVSDSVVLGSPLILVTVNFRLNVFAFGNGEGEKNLALQDQRLAIDWVVRNIAAFGGDPKRITLAGESAGAVHVHAHVLSKAPVQQAFMASGSLHLSPPLPAMPGQALLQRVRDSILRSHGSSLEVCPASAIPEALTKLGVNSMWLQAESSLDGWQEWNEQISSLMIGDVEYESVIWHTGIESMSAEQIYECFEKAGKHATKLMEIYHIDRRRPRQCKIGALDFINDARFALPVEAIATRWRGNGYPVYQYLFDQPNPWQTSSRAHHAVDLISLFGTLDTDLNSSAQRVGGEIRKRFIMFTNNQAPWASQDLYAFGPYGKSGVVDADEHSQRRRTSCLEALERIGWAGYNPVFGALTAGRISLLN